MKQFAKPAVQKMIPDAVAKPVLTPELIEQIDSLAVFKTRPLKSGKQKYENARRYAEVFTSLPIVKVPNVSAQMMKHIASKPKVDYQSSVVAEHHSVGSDNNEDIAFIEQRKEPSLSLFPAEKAAFRTLERIDEMNNEGTTTNKAIKKRK